MFSLSGCKLCGNCFRQDFTFRRIAWRYRLFACHSERQSVSNVQRLSSFAGKYSDSVWHNQKSSWRQIGEWIAEQYVWKQSISARSVLHPRVFAGTWWTWIDLRLLGAGGTCTSRRYRQRSEPGKPVRMFKLARV